MKLFQDINFNICLALINQTEYAETLPPTHWTQKKGRKGKEVSTHNLDQSICTEKCELNIHIRVFMHTLWQHTSRAAESALTFISGWVYAWACFFGVPLSWQGTELCLGLKFTVGQDSTPASRCCKYLCFCRPTRNSEIQTQLYFQNNILYLVFLVQMSLHQQEVRLSSQYCCFDPFQIQNQLPGYLLSWIYMGNYSTWDLFCYQRLTDS